MCWLQGVVGRLLDDMLSVFPREWIFTTEDKAAFGQGVALAAAGVGGSRRCC